MRLSESNATPLPRRLLISPKGADAHRGPRQMATPAENGSATTTTRPIRPRCSSPRAASSAPAIRPANAAGVVSKKRAPTLLDHARGTRASPRRQGRARRIARRLQRIERAVGWTPLILARMIPRRRFPKSPWAASVLENCRRRSRGDSEITPPWLFSPLWGGTAKEGGETGFRRSRGARNPHYRLEVGAGATFRPPDNRSLYCCIADSVGEPNSR